MSHDLPSPYIEHKGAPTSTTQQEWAQRAYGLLREHLVHDAPRDTIVSYGFPKGGGRRTIGICHCGPIELPDGVQAVIFISPRQWCGPIDVLHVLLHEMLHAALPPGTGHRHPFGRRARMLGLEGRPSATVPGVPLRARLEGIAELVGSFPAARFDLDTGKAHVGSRLRLWVCRCGLKIRAAHDDLHIRCEDCDSLFKRCATAGQMSGEEGSHARRRKRIATDPQSRSPRSSWLPQL